MPRYGVIYIAHNPRDGADMFKVGKTERSVQERMAELTADTSNIGTYATKAIFVVTDVDAAEKACHKRLKRYRVQPNREFFNLKLDRLVQAVEEETSPFSASDVIPEPSSAKPSPSRPRSTLEKIEAVKQNRANAEEQFEKATEDAEADLEKSVAVIREKVLAIRDQLSDFDFLTWKIPSTFEEVKEGKGRGTICSVMFHSRFSGEPPVLKLSDLRGGPYGEPDLSRAVEEPKAKHRDMLKSENWELVEWKEVDDGRYGRVEINGRIDRLLKDSGGGRVRLVFGVGTESIKYDDYHNSWKEHYSEHLFSNPEEALEVFEGLIIVNSTQPAVDVRTLGEMSTPRRGRTFQKVRDRGIYFFKTTLPEDEDNLLDDLLDE